MVDFKKALNARYGKFGKRESETMPKVSEMYSGKYLSAADIKGKPYKGIINDVNEVEMKDDSGDAKQRIALTLSDLDKLFIVNATNAGEISEVLGDDTDNWFGAEIHLSVGKVLLRGKPVDGIKVKSVHVKK